jgi:hypothetical protein
MKTPYKIAKEIGVTPQAVYNKLTPEFTTLLSNHIQRNEKGKYSLDAVAEGKLKGLFNLLVQPIEQTIEPVEQALLNQLNSENAFLRKQVEIQAKQISELTTALENTTSSLQASQALHAGSMKQLVSGSTSSVQPEPTEATTKSFIQRLFKLGAHKM